MTPHQRRKRLREEIVTATMRLDWAKAEAKRNPTTPALTSFIKASQAERRTLKMELAKLVKRRVKWRALKAALKGEIVQP